MTEQQAMRMALEALITWEKMHPTSSASAVRQPAITALRQALEQKPSTWVGLTDEEIVLIVGECAASHQHTDIHFARAIEAVLRSKNT